MATHVCLLSYNVFGRFQFIFCRGLAGLPLQGAFGKLTAQSKNARGASRAEAASRSRKKRGINRRRGGGGGLLAAGLMWCHMAGVSESWKNFEKVIPNIFFFFSLLFRDIFHDIKTSKMTVAVSPQKLTFFQIRLIIQIFRCCVNL